MPNKLSTSRSRAPSISGLSVRPEIVSIKFRARGSAGGTGSTTVSLDCRVPVCDIVALSRNNRAGKRKCLIAAGTRENSQRRPVIYPVVAQIKEPGNWERASWPKRT